MKDKREAKPYRADVRAAGWAKAEEQVIATFTKGLGNESFSFYYSLTRPTCLTSLTSSVLKSSMADIV